MLAEEYMEYNREDMYMLQTVDELQHWACKHGLDPENDDEIKLRKIELLALDIISPPTEKIDVAQERHLSQDVHFLDRGGSCSDYPSHYHNTNVILPNDIEHWLRDLFSCDTSIYSDDEENLIQLKSLAELVVTNDQQNESELSEELHCLKNTTDNDVIIID